jgi:hypothetical protein
MKLLDRINNFESLFCMHKSWRTWSVRAETEVLAKETNCVDTVGSVKKSVNPFKRSPCFCGLELNILVFEALLAPYKYSDNKMEDINRYRKICQTQQKVIYCYTRQLVSTQLWGHHQAIISNWRNRSTWKCVPYGIPFSLHMTAVHTVSNNIHIGGIVQMLYTNRYIGHQKNCGLL